MGAGASSSSSSSSPVVLITGCSAGGMGHALALEFLRAGCHVVATARSLDSMSALAAHHSPPPSSSPPPITLLALDINSDASRDAAVSEALRIHGRIDILVNNAGMLCIGPVAELPASLIHQTFATNVFSPIRLIQAVVPQMIERRSGKIVNIGSVTGFSGSPWAGGYAASKAAFHTLSDSLRLELKPFGIDVIVVAPGGIKSNLEGNAQQVYDTLPRWKFYQPWEKFIRLRMGYSQQRGATTAKEFAKRTVAAVLKKKPPAYFITGHLSYVVTSLSYLPLFLRDFIFSKMFGLRVHLSSGKSA